MKLILTILILSLTAFAQKVDAPEVHKLTHQASQVFMNIDKAEAELTRQYRELEDKRAILLIGANVPQEFSDCSAAPDGIVVCTKPIKIETEKKK